MMDDPESTRLETSVETSCIRINMLMKLPDSDCFSLISQQVFDAAKGNDVLSLKCSHCNLEFSRAKRDVVDCIRYSKTNNFFCSKRCYGNSLVTHHMINCTQCQLPTKVLARNYNKSVTKRFYCSSSCAATYNNTHKTHGNRRSKLEAWLEEQLTTRYPMLHIDFNKKHAIDSELDIYVDELKFAVELNGIYHYEPIHGHKLLEKTQNNDNRKFQACLERGIELCIINTSSQKVFKPETSAAYLHIITNIIDDKLSATLAVRRGNAPLPQE